MYVSKAVLLVWQWLRLASNCQSGHVGVQRVKCCCVEYGRFEAKIREIREQMLQTTGNGGSDVQSQQQTGRFVRYLLCFHLCRTVCLCEHEKYVLGWSECPVVEISCSQ